LLPRGVFSLDAGFSIRVTPQQPKLLCSSPLGETCPYPPDAVGGVLVGGSEPLLFTDVNAVRPPEIPQFLSPSAVL
jgi:hypothetical protein